MLAGWSSGSSTPARLGTLLAQVSLKRRWPEPASVRLCGHADHQGIVDRGCPDLALVTTASCLRSSCRRDGRLNLPPSTGRGRAEWSALQHRGLQLRSRCRPGRVMNTITERGDRTRFSAAPSPSPCTSGMHWPVTCTWAAERHRSGSGEAAVFVLYVGSAHFARSL